MAELYLYRILLNRLPIGEPWLIFVFILAAAAIERLQPLVVGAILFLSLLHLIMERRFTHHSPVDWASGLLLLTTVTSLWVTPLPQESCPQVVRLFLGVFVFYYVINWGNNHFKVEHIVDVIVFCGVMIALVTPLIILVFLDKPLPLPPVIILNLGFLLQEKVNPNVMAGFLVIILPLAFAKLLYWNKDLRSVVYLFSLILILSALFLTRSRGAILAFIISAIFVMGLRWRKVVIPIVILFVGTLSIIMWMIIKTSPVNKSLLVGTIETRLEVWNRAFVIIRDFPISGIGMGTFSKVADTMYPFFLSEPGSIHHAHNLFLQIALDLGLPGLIAWMAILIFITISALNIYETGRSLNNQAALALGTGLVGCNVALVAHGLTDMVVWGMMRLAPLIWGIWGLAISGQMVFNQNENKQ